MPPHLPPRALKAQKPLLPAAPRSAPRRISAYWLTLHTAGFTRVDAVLPVPRHEGDFYIFRGPDYLRLILNPDNLSETLHGFGPRYTAENWPSLRTAGFKVLDAAGPVPGAPDDAYLFSGPHYVCVSLDPGTLRDTLVSGPHEITWAWPTLRACGFTVIDVAIPVPDSPWSIYFFRGARYTRVVLDATSFADTLADPGSSGITDSWGSIRDAGFTSLDAVMRVPGRPRELYVFSGSEYIRIRLEEAGLQEIRL